MTRIVIFLAALLAALLVLWMAGAHTFQGARMEKVPATVAIERQFPDRDENESAARFLATLTRLDQKKLLEQRETVVEYIRKEVASPDAASEPPPVDLAAFLRENAATLGMLRAQLASNPAPVWKQRAGDLLETPQPDVIPIYRLFLLLAADALSEHSAHRDAAAWSDLGASWILTKSLWARPEIPSMLSALTGSRLIAAVATRLPAPAPPWWQEYTTYDIRPPFARALEYEAWAMHTRADRYPLGEPDDGDPLHQTVLRAIEPVARPIRVLQADAHVRDIRQLSREMPTLEPCSPTPQSARERWQDTLNRLHRFVIEREAAARLLAIDTARKATGALPPAIDSGSACHGAQWLYKPTADGFTLSFNGHLPAVETRVVTPLQYRR